jgi:hypothetical protein
MRSYHVFDNFILHATLRAIAGLYLADVHSVNGLAPFAFPVFTAESLVLILLFFSLCFPLVVVVLELAL